MSKKLFYFLISTYLLCTSSIAQELPPVQNFTSFDYNAENQNWSISQSSNKNIFIANNSGLLEYNSESWTINQSPNNTIIRSVKNVKNKIYTGCYMEFGYWEKNDFGKLIYTSLANKLKQPMTEEEQFWNIQDLDNWIIFQSLRRIYIYNTIDDTFKIIDAISNKPKVFKINGTIYYQHLNLGIFKIEQGKSILVTNHSVFKTTTLVDLLLKNNKLLAITEKGKFYFIKDDKVEEWKLSAYNKIRNINVYSSLQSKNGNFLLGTISNGLIIIDKNGELQYQFNKVNGLINNTILSIFEDFDDNIWLGLDNGISVINLKSSFKVYKDLKGNLGVVYVSVIYNNNLYLGTNQGLFYRKLDSNNEFKLINNTKGQVWSLDVIDNTLFCGHNLGTFIINNNTAKQIANIPGTWVVKPVKNRNDLIIQGNYGGLNILEKINDNWIFKNTLEGFNISSRFFEFISENKIVVVNEQKGINFLETDANYTKIIKHKANQHEGYGLGLIRFNNEIIFSSNLGAEVFDKEKNLFVKDSVLSQKFFNQKDPTVGILISDELNNKIWSFSKKNIICLSQGRLDEFLYETKIPIPSSFRKNLGIAGFECLSSLTKNKYLIGNSDGYVALDLSKLTKKKYSINIDKVINSNLSDDFFFIDLQQKENEFKNKDNNVEIHFSTKNYNHFLETQYQYQLLGLYDKWQDWSIDSKIKFNNLPFGEYTFNVRARIGNILTNNIATYNFKIQKPWYLSNLMIWLYLLSILLFSLLMHKIYKRYYTKQREKHLEATQRELKVKELENEQQKMHFENDKLHNDIESKTRELAISTMSLIKKNEFLNHIKKELLANVEKQKIKSVLKIIDNNLNNTDDWNLFKEAFNSVDRGFMKKIKTIHSNLTPQDLRLCAYLRLNLSSKEIAPLLNISSKSVEVKRYRLRKKMNLPHETSLTNYILKM